VPISVAELQPALHELFTATADQLAKDAQFCRRKRKLTGSVFARTLVFGLLRHPQATLQDLADFAHDRLATSFSVQALDQRFGEQAADFLAGLLDAALQLHFPSARPAPLPVLRRFNGVYLRDATLVGLPDGLIGLSPGRTGRSGPSAAAKVVVEVDATTGVLSAVQLLPGRANEKTAAVSHAPLPEGALLLEDMGFLSAQRLRNYIEQGVYVLTRVPAWCAVFAPDGTRIDLAGELEAAGGWYVERDVLLFHDKVPMRLLASRLPDEVAERRRQRLRKEARKRGRPAGAARLALCEWNVLLTNAPAAKLGAQEGWDVRMVRWQQELGFRGMKSGGGGLGFSRSCDGWRVLCEVYARLLGAVVRSWVQSAAGFAGLRDSVQRASASARRWAGPLVKALARPERMARLIGRIAEQSRRRGRTQRRRKGPSTYDRLLRHDPLFDPDDPPAPP
jgi:hypothetical protein